ncbi:MAG: hypothetical protein RL009_365 [Actinomycetota bacterium]|mgnify:FL=1
MRKLLAAASAALLALSLSSCSSINSEQAMFDTLKPACGDVSTQPTSGREVDRVTVSGTDAEPKVDFAAPLSAKDVQTKVLSEGTGPKITGNQTVSLEYLGVNAGTGEVFQPTAFDTSGASVQVLTPDQEPGFCEALGSVREGSRVAILFPASVIHQNQGIEQLKLGKNDDVLFIMQIHKVYLPYAVGNERPAQTGFPTIVRAVNGIPGVKIPTESPFPKASKDGQEATAMEVLIEGAGEAVVEGDSVLLHYAGYTWADGAKFDSSWDKNTPATFTIAKGQLIQGFVDAVVGQKVGSQIVAVIPPNLGYGDQAQGTIPANSTLVFVIDILGIQK